MRRSEALQAAALGKLEICLQACDRASDLASEGWRSYLDCGDLLRRQGRPWEAIAVLRAGTRRYRRRRVSLRHFRRSWRPEGQLGLLPPSEQPLRRAARAR